jgi:hypothetical protein
LTTSQPNTTDIEDGEDNEGPHGPGEFDQDEPEEVLRKVMASKSSGHQVQASAGSGSGSLSRSATPAISQWGASGGPLVTRKTDQVCIELLMPVCDHKLTNSKSSGHQVQASAGSGSGSLSRSTTPAISQWGASGGPLVTRKTDQVCIELLMPVRDHKLTNSKMGVQITQVNSTTNDSDATANRKNGRKQKYTTLDLPYPPGGKNSENWKLLNAKVISWAGAQEDPFGTNGRLDTDIDTLWESVFPGSALDVQGRKRALVVVCLSFWDSAVHVTINTFQVRKLSQ